MFTYVTVYTMGGGTIENSNCVSFVDADVSAHCGGEVGFVRSTLFTTIHASCSVGSMSIEVHKMPNTGAGTSTTRVFEDADVAMVVSKVEGSDLPSTGERTLGMGRA